MCAAAKLGVRLGVTPPDIPGRISDTCGALGLPTQITCSMEDYAAAVGLDKKGAGEDITLILLDKIGHAVPRKMPRRDLLALLEVLS